MNPVASITPAAKALIMKNMSFSGRRAENLRPRRGRLMPAAPEVRTPAMAASLSLSACFAWRCSAFSRPPWLVQLCAETVGGIKIRIMRVDKIVMVVLCL